MIVTSFLLLSGVCAGEALENAMVVRVTGPWEVGVGPGTVQVDGREIALAEAVRVEIPPAERIRVRGERHAALPVFNPKTGGWVKGAKLKRLVTQECTATGLLEPKSVRVKPAGGAAPPLVDGKDYAIDAFWGTFGRLEGGAIPEGRPVLVDYDYSPCRLHSVVVNAAGEIRLAVGEPGMGSQLPPATVPGEVALATVWVPGRTEQLAEENVFPIEFKAWPPDGPQAEKLLPRTLAKLRAGQPVTIVAWGDSVTNGGGVGGHTEQWYQNRFLGLSRARFPKATITLKTAAWGGGNSKGYMSAPRGGQYDFVRDVLEPKPDLVTIEFVNDAYLHGQAMAQHYTVILERLRGVGAEVVLITPHLVRPDWMGVSMLKFDEDPRPYVKALHEFAARNELALADASKGWCRLWRKGIPYVTLLANSINHPDARGHEIFAQALIELFP